jgi:hypothetical protein
MLLGFADSCNTSEKYGTLPGTKTIKVSNDEISFIYLTFTIDNNYYFYFIFFKTVVEKIIC